MRKKNISLPYWAEATVKPLQKRAEVLKLEPLSGNGGDGVGERQGRLTNLKCREESRLGGRDLKKKHLSSEHIGGTESAQLRYIPFLM